MIHFINLSSLDTSSISKFLLYVTLHYIILHYLEAWYTLEVYRGDASVPDAIITRSCECRIIRSKRYLKKNSNIVCRKNSQK